MIFEDEDAIWRLSAQLAPMVSTHYLPFMIKLGTFSATEAVFARYKEYKEDFIKDMAEQYRDEIPHAIFIFSKKL